MQKQPHRAIAKTADNRYWQNQFHNDDAELEPSAEFQEYAPPMVAAPDAGTVRDGKPGPRESD